MCSLEEEQKTTDQKTTDGVLSLASEIKELKKKLLRANVEGARVTEAYRALRAKKPLGHIGATVESYDVADWPYPPDWEAQKEWVESLKAEIERLTRERDEERAKLKETEAEKAAMVKVIEPWVCKSLRENGPIACNTCEAVIEKCRFQLATHALANLTPEAARMVRIREAAQQYRIARDRLIEKHSIGNQFQMDYAKNMLVEEAVRGEGEKP
jgi:hypothetical protein